MARTLYRATSLARLTEFEDNAVVLDLASDTYYALNATGLLVWNGLNEGRTVTEVIDVVAAAYRLDRTAVAADVDRVVRDMVDARLLAPYTGR